MAKVGVAFVLRVCSVCALGGSGGMLPQEHFGLLDHLGAFLVHSEGVKVRYLPSR